jgi:hypothetical protein
MGLSCNLFPTKRTIKEKPYHGWGGGDEVLLYCNSDESEKLKPLVTGKYAKSVFNTYILLNDK